MKVGTRSDNELTRLIAVLERSFKRNGVFYICTLGEGHQHEHVEQVLIHHLENRHIPTVSYQFDPITPFKEFLGFFSQLKAKGQRQVLVTWCLEHLPDPTLFEVLRSLNVCRGRLCQTTQKGQVSIPIILLVDASYYSEYLARQARDLLDCLSPPFDLSTVNLQEALNGNVS